MINYESPLVYPSPFLCIYLLIICQWLTFDLKLTSLTGNNAFEYIHDMLICQVVSMFFFHIHLLLPSRFFFIHWMNHLKTIKINKSTIAFYCGVWFSYSYSYLVLLTFWDWTFHKYCIEQLMFKYVSWLANYLARKGSTSTFQHSVHSNQRNTLLKKMNIWINWSTFIRLLLLCPLYFYTQYRRRAKYFIYK